MDQQQILEKMMADRQGFAERVYRMIMDRPVGQPFLLLSEQPGIGVEITMNFASVALAFGIMDVARLHIAEGTGLAMTAVGKNGQSESQDVVIGPDLGKGYKN